MKAYKQLLWCCSALLGVQFMAQGALLTNRFSFTADVTDSVGGLNGSTPNGATFAAGAAELDGVSQYVLFPNNIMSGLQALTFETWITPTGLSAVSNPWARIWDFGGPTTGPNRFFYSRIGNTSAGVLSSFYIAGPNDNVCDAASTTVFQNNVEGHLVWTSDPVTRKAKMYFNGKLVAVNNENANAATNSPFGVLLNNAWLGQSQFPVDGFTPMKVNEFRIWNGALNQLEVAASSQSGPDTVSTNYGTVTNLTLTASTSMVLGTVQQAGCVAAASGLTNKAVDVRDQLNVIYTSDNTNILTVTTGARITATGAGTGHVTAKLGSVSNTVTITVTTLPTVLAHRYSFNGDAVDSIGGKDGTFIGVTSDGVQVFLPGDAAPGNYVELPPYLIHPTNVPQASVTFVAWASFDANVNWARMFDFGVTAGGAGSKYIFFTPSALAGGTESRFEVQAQAFSAQNLIVPGGLSGQANMNIACVYNPNPNRRYLGLAFNGNTVSSRFDLNVQLAELDNQNSWLGRSLFGLDSYMAGSIDEFRIYNGELSKPQIAAAFQSGPTSTNINPGVCTNLAVSLGAPTMAIEQFRDASVLAAFTILTNKALNVIGDPGCSLTSSDPTVLSIDATSGRMHALKLGTATISAIFGGFTNSQAIAVVLPPTRMQYRYSFNESSGTTAEDSIAGADGTLIGGATFIGDSVLLNGLDGYVELPAGIISALGNNMTFEAWMTNSASGNWSRIFDFGSAGDFTFLVPNEGGGLLRFDTSSGGAFNSAAAFPVNAMTHVVLVYDFNDNYSKAYVNGVLVGSGGAPKPFSTMVDTSNWLGRSEFPDPFLNGSYDEVRIYSGLLTEAAIARDILLGPNQVIANVPLSFSTGGGNITLSWPNYAAAFVLESTTTLNGTWTPAAGTVVQSGNTYQLTVPMSGSARFFRLRQ
jgi:concanavalin A-like lectin/glucanase superfamily protein